MKPQKTLTIEGRRYRITVRAWDALLQVEGPGLVVGCVLPAGVRLDSSDLREQVIEALSRAKANSRAAAEAVCDLWKKDTN